MSFSATIACRTALCEDNEHCHHTVRCCRLMYTGDCNCQETKVCCVCDMSEPCPEALREARVYLAFGGITHDLNDLLLR